MEKLVLIDGNSLINRAFYAMPLLTTKDGEYTNAVYGFMTMFFKMLGDVKPTYVAVAFDVHAPTFRHEKYKEYKGTRKSMPEELRPQMGMLKNLLKLMGVYTIEKAGLEADDLIGTIAKSTKIKTYIYTGDKDSFQLVDETTEVRFTRRGMTETEIYNASNFNEKTGILPHQIIDLKALMGDQSDNIPGVPGIGEKTAVSLIQTYDNVDNLYANISSLSGKLKEKIEAGRESAFLSRELATINISCDVDFNIENMKYPFPFSSAVKKEFARLEFKTLYLRAELFEPPTAGNYICENSERVKVNKFKVEDLSDEKLKTALDAADELSVTIEEYNVNVYDKNTEYVFPVKKTLFDDGFELPDILRYLSAYFNGNKTLIVYDKKQLRHTLKDGCGIDFSAPCEDLRIIKYLADFSGKNETLLDVILSYQKEESLPAFSQYEIYVELKAKLVEENMRELYENVELPLADVLFDMEETGFKIDYAALDETGVKFKAFLSETENSIRELTNEPDLNINSPKQLGETLFEKLKIGKGKKTKSGYSTGAEVLESLENAHPVVPLILKYRQIQKLYSTYVEGFKPLIDRKSGVIKTSFNQTVTSTGRLSSKEPNLQNIPVREEEGKELRKFFVPRNEERILVGADYSQIELRLLAAFSGCEALINAFRNGKDVHAETAAKVFGVKESAVTPEMRRSAKAVNFGIIYGISEYGLAKNIKTSPAKAKDYIAAYFREYPEVKKYMEDNVAFAKNNGYAVTMLGRRRYIKEIFSSNYNLRQFGERAAMNMPLQGSAADIIKLAMLNVYNRLKAEGLKSQLILQIHDELIIDAYKTEREEVEKILVEEMGGAVKLSVPLTVSLGAGETWYDAK